ncbi:mechanosensitive ion channel [Erythrobacter sp. HKB08]|uniref:mechanosensitive ion channel n=1 Tax=Erythrobacter sp. HKB08 TaxID=2502843 RepID=UPI001008EA4F|nr:mechanosensitive ion channel [Erythrobacter sp. HKB08]
MRLGNYRFDPELAMELAEKAFFVVAILVITWALAKAAKWAFAKLVDNISFLQRDTSGGDTVGESLGKIVSMLIWLFGLLAVLTVLGLGGVMEPIEVLLNNIMGFIPNLIGAGLIFFIGLMVARIVRDLVITALKTVDFDKWANRGGVDNVTGNTTISSTIGTIVYVLIIIPVAIAALEQLNIESISGPASGMLSMIFAAIPNIIAAAILLGIGYLISRFVVDILKELLTGLGVDRSLSATGLLPDGTAASTIIARIVQVAIILFFAIAATRILGFPELTNILNEVLELGGRVVFGAVVIGVGFLIANLLARLVSGADEGSMAGTIIRWVTIVLFVFMGLNYTGVAEIITETAFSAIVIGIAVAGALAFGLGGRDWAARQLDKMESKADAAPKDNDPLPPGA